MGEWGLFYLLWSPMMIDTFLANAVREQTFCNQYYSTFKVPLGLMYTAELYNLCVLLYLASALILYSIPSYLLF